MSCEIIDQTKLKLMKSPDTAITASAGVRNVKFSRNSIS